MIYKLIQTTLKHITHFNMEQQEYNEWWFNHYCEMGVKGFPDPRDNDFGYTPGTPFELFGEPYHCGNGES
jgi:hypothetical protein